MTFQHDNDPNGISRFKGTPSHGHASRAVNVCDSSARNAPLGTISSGIQSSRNGSPPITPGAVTPSARSSCARSTAAAGASRRFYDAGGNVRLVRLGGYATADALEADIRAYALRPG